MLIRFLHLVSRCVVALVILVGIAGCTLDRSAERAFLAGDPGTAIEALDLRIAEASNNLALEENLRGTVSLVAGDYRRARESLVTAGRIMGSFPETGAREIAAIVGRESTRHYLGDPYEAALNSLYAAVALLAGGDEQNARAAIKSGILADSDVEEEQYRSDIVALYLLEAFLALRNGSTELARRDLEQVREIDPRYSLANEKTLEEANTLIVIDTGIGPRKVRTGNYGEKAAFRTPPPVEFGVRLSLDETRQLVPLPSVDVDYQARTRGGRPMDYILGGKAVLKGGSEVAGVILLDQAARHHNSKLAVIGGALLLFSLLLQPQADVRHWHLLPATVHLWLGRVEPGLHTVRLDFETPSRRPLPAYEQVWHHLPFSDERLNVYYFRSGFHKGFRRPNRDGESTTTIEERKQP